MITILKQSGVKGMRWGVRKDKKGSGRRGMPKADNSRIGKPPSADSVRAARLGKSKGAFVDELSNKELKIVSERIRLEKEYRKLNPSVVEIGKKIVGGIIGQLGKQVASNIISNTAGPIAKQIMNLAEQKD